MKTSFANDQKKTIEMKFDLVSPDVPDAVLCAHCTEYQGWYMGTCEWCQGTRRQVIPLSEFGVGAID
jgi:hypothetical protein